MSNDNSIEKAFNLISAQKCLDENLPEEAVMKAEARLMQVPEDIDAKIILCQGLLRLGKLERLRQLLGEIDETITRLSSVYLHLGELCRKSGLHTESANFLNKYEALSSVFTRKSECETTPVPETPFLVAENEAEEDMKAGDISPEFYTITLAELYLRQGHPEQAREVLEVILSKDPQNEPAAIKLTELRKNMTDEMKPVSAVSSIKTEAVPDNAALVAELDGWLARIIQMRSTTL